jgi:hypothetical protein
MKDYPSEAKILESMLAQNPSERPSAAELKKTLDQLYESLLRDRAPSIVTAPDVELTTVSSSQFSRPRLRSNT